MNHFSRPTLALGTLTFIAVGVVFVPLAYSAPFDLRPASNAADMLVASGSAQGYLGVGMRDVDSDRAAALKLKEARGAEIVSIDQDAPVANSGLKIHDVVVQMNGQRIESVEQFRRMQHEMPPGRTISLVAMRDGNPVNLNVQLADRAQLATRVIGNLDSDTATGNGSSSANGSSSDVVLPGDAGHRNSHSSGFFGSLSRNRYYVGVDIQPLPTGLADYFGVKGGVLVGNVFANSPGAAAGLKPADVIQKVNGQPIVTLSDWEKAIHANRGKRVQVTIIRDHKEQILSMVAGEAKNSGDVASPTPDPRAVAALREQLQ